MSKSLRGKPELPFSHAQTSLTAMGAGAGRPRPCARLASSAVTASTAIAGSAGGGKYAGPTNTGAVFCRPPTDRRRSFTRLRTVPVPAAAPALLVPVWLRPLSSKAKACSSSTLSTAEALVSNGHDVGAAVVTAARESSGTKMRVDASALMNLSRITSPSPISISSRNTLRPLSVSWRCKASHRPNSDLCRYEIKMS